MTGREAIGDVSPRAPGNEENRDDRERQEGEGGESRRATGEANQAEDRQSGEQEKERLPAAGDPLSSYPRPEPSRSLSCPRRGDRGPLAER